MIWLKLIALITFTSITVLGDFEEAALKGKECGQLSQLDCLTYHEAIDKCAGNCGGGGGSSGPASQAASGSPPPDEGKKKGKGKNKCFHGDDMVVTNNGDMKIQDLVGQENVQVLSRNAEGRLEFSPIYSWLHADPSQKSDYIVLTTESGHKLPLSDAHLIYDTDCRGNSKTVFAGRVKIGRCLYVNDNGEIKESKVVDKKVETKVGIFAPITANGNIVVNGVLASCFTNYEDEEFQKIIYSFLHTVGRVFDKVMPSSLFELVFNTPFSTLVDVPQAFLSFFDLHKVFMK